MSESSNKCCVVLDLTRKKTRQLGAEATLFDLGKRVKTLLIGGNSFETLSLSYHEYDLSERTRNKARISDEDAIDDIVFSQTLTELWRVDASNNVKLCDVSGLSAYCALGFVDLSGCDLTWEALSSLSNVHIGFLNLQHNPKLRSPEIDDGEYRFCVICVLPKVWVLDGEIILDEERGNADIFIRTCADTHPIRQICAQLDELRASHWSTTSTVSEDASWFWQQGVAKRSRKTDGFRGDVVQSMCERQLLAEKRYDYVQVRAVDAQSFPFFTSNMLNTLSNVCILDVQDRLDLVTVCIATLSAHYSKKQVNELITNLHKHEDLPDVNTILSWPMFVRQLLIAQLLGTLHTDARELRTQFSDEDYELVINTKCMQLCRRKITDSKSAEAWPQSAWQTRAIVLLDAIPKVASQNLVVPLQEPAINAKGKYKTEGWREAGNFCGDNESVTATSTRKLTRIGKNEQNTCKWGAAGAVCLRRGMRRNPLPREHYTLPHLQQTAADAYTGHEMRWGSHEIPRNLSYARHNSGNTKTDVRVHGRNRKEGLMMSGRTEDTNCNSLRRAQQRPNNVYSTVQWINKPRIMQRPALASQRTWYQVPAAATLVVNSFNTSSKDWC